MNEIKTKVNFDPSNSFGIHFLQYSNWEFWKTGKTVCLLPDQLIKLL